MINATDRVARVLDYLEHQLPGYPFDPSLDAPDQRQLELLASDN